MKNIFLLIVMLISIVSFAQEVSEKKQLSLKIRDNARESNISKKNNDHQIDYITLSDKIEHNHKPNAVATHTRPHFDKNKKELGGNRTENKLEKIKERKENKKESQRENIREERHERKEIHHRDR